MHKGEKYNETVRKFILTLRFYSPRAYDYVREKFNNNLPHPATIRKWYQRSSVQSQSGLCQRSIEILKEKALDFQKEGKNLYCGLVHDEMSIRQHVQWLDYKKEFSGFINFGKVAEDSETLPIATHVLVFLLNGITIPFNLPIAYYFITDLEGIDKAILMSSIVRNLTDIGVRVLTSTFDGNSANIVACEILGCSFDVENFNPKFKNVRDPLCSIHAIFDAPHMLKLIRNHLANKKIFYDRLGRKIEWRYFELLLTIKNEENLVSHKLTQRHIHFENHAMKVSLAAQTFSNSSAKTMQFLMENKHPEFENAAGTIEFSERMDKLFDVLNSDSERPNNPYKTALTAQTNDDIFTFLDDTTDYIKRLTLEPFGKRIIDSDIKVGFKGMIIDIENIKSIYTKYVKEGDLKQFNVRRIGQCPLESLFSRCRSHSMLGSNTNPTVLQFRSLMRKILVNNEITGSTFANCVDKLDVLFLSSKVQPQNVSMQRQSVEDGISALNEAHQERNLYVDDNPECLASENEEIFQMEDRLKACVSNQEIGIAYIAGQIEKRLSLDKKIQCNLCVEVFSENDKLIVAAFPKTKANIIPCRSTYDLCELTDKIFSPKMLKKDFNYTEIMNEIFTAIHASSIFPNSTFSLHPTHKKLLIKYIIEEYITARATEVCQRLTLDIQMKRCKQKRAKLSVVKHFQGR